MCQRLCYIFPEFSHVMLTLSQEMGITCIPTSHMKKVRPKVVQGLGNDRSRLNPTSPDWYCGASLQHQTM